MKKIDFSQSGGFPLEQMTLDFMQQAYIGELLPAFLDWIIRKSSFTVRPEHEGFILSGLNERTQDGLLIITPGWIVRDGELLRFAGGQKNEIDERGIGIQKLRTSAIFKDNSVHDVYEEKTAVVGGENPIALERFKRVINLADLRPIFSTTIRKNVGFVAAGSHATISFSIAEARKGDVAAVHVTEAADSDIPPVYGILNRIIVHPVIAEDGVLKVTLINLDPTQPAFSGDIDFHIRIIK